MVLLALRTQLNTEKSINKGYLHLLGTTVLGIFLNSFLSHSIPLGECRLCDSLPYWVVSVGLSRAPLSMPGTISVLNMY